MRRGWRCLRWTRSLVPALGVVILAPSLMASASTFTTVNAPFVASNDFITGLPTCTPEGVEGPIGILQDTSHFYVGDLCSNTLYRFPLSGGNGNYDVSLQNNLAGGMATGGGHYYGVNLSSATPMVEEFDPNTLAPTRIVMTDTQPLRDLLYDPQTGDLYATGDAGVYRIQNPSTTPIVTLWATAPNGAGFDGIAISPDDTKIWVAAHHINTIYAYSTSGSTVYALVTQCHHPDGMAIAPPNIRVGGLDVSNDVFVNCNDGTIWMIDPTNGTNAEVASGGLRGDFATVGVDGFMYATSGDRVEQLVPGFFGHGDALADAFTASATVRKAGAPVAGVPPVADERSGAGTVTGSVQQLALPASLGEIVAGENTASVTQPFNGSARAEAKIASVVLDVPGVPSLGIPPCEITADGLTTVVTGSTGSGGAHSLQLDPASGIADLSICGLRVTSPGSPHVFPLPGGIGTLAVFDQISGPPGYNPVLEAEALHLHLALADATVDVVVGDANVTMF